MYIRWMLGGDTEPVIELARESGFSLARDHVFRFLRSHKVIGLVASRREDSGEVRPAPRGVLFYTPCKNHLYVSHLVAPDPEAMAALVERMASKVGEKRKYFLLRVRYGQTDLLDFLKNMTDESGLPRVGFEDTDEGYYIAQFPRSNIRPAGTPKELIEIESGS